MSFGDGTKQERIERLEKANGELCAEINRQERVIEELTAELDRRRGNFEANLGAVIRERAEMNRYVKAQKADTERANAALRAQVRDLEAENARLLARNVSLESAIEGPDGWRESYSQLLDVSAGLLHALDVLRINGKQATGRLVDHWEQRMAEVAPSVVVE